FSRDWSSDVCSSDPLARAAALAPERAAPLAALGDLARAAGTLDEAIGRYRQALRLDDSQGALWVKLGNALMAADAPREALEAYRSEERRVGDADCNR